MLDLILRFLEALRDAIVNLFTIPPVNPNF